MAFWNEISNRRIYLILRSSFDRELDEEILLHMLVRADELEQAGLSAGDALLQARREFASLPRTCEETCSAWQIFWQEDLGSDLRYAARALRVHPVVALRHEWARWSAPDGMGSIPVLCGADRGWYDQFGAFLQSRWPVSYVDPTQLT